MPVKNRLESDYNLYVAPLNDDEYRVERRHRAIAVLDAIPYTKTYEPQDLSPEDWDKLAEANPKDWDKIIEFGNALRLGFERREKAHLENSHESYYRDEMLTQWGLDSDSKALLNLILWARTPDYYELWRISEENEIIYSELTNMRIFEDEGGTAIFEGRFISPELIVERVLNHNLQLDPSFVPEAK